MKQANSISASIIACGLALAACGLATNSTQAADLATDSAPTAATTKVPDPDPKRFDFDIRNFATRDQKNSYPHDAVLFVGSSSIRNWQTADGFPSLPVINRGFGGSQISDVNHYFDDVVSKYRPKIIVFYSGDNDTQAGKTPEQIFGDVDTFVHRVHESLPETYIYLLPIKPSLARWEKWPRMQQTNALIAKLDKRDDRLEMVDTATPLLGTDGKPRPELFIKDGLHLNDKGYAIWNEILTPILKKALAARQ